MATTRMVHNVARLFSDLWNKIKPSTLTLSVSEDDIVIFVVGPTGSGKSWFIKSATRGDLVKSSRDYHPFTTKVLAIRCELTDEARTDLQGVKSIVFVDTPSFLTGYDNFDPCQEIESWIKQKKFQTQYLGGIIYMHRIETDPAHEPVQGHLQELIAAIPGISENHSRLHFVVSYDTSSGKISDSKVTKHEANLRAQVNGLSRSTWQSSIHQVHFQGEPQVAWKAVEELLVDGRIDHED